MRPLLLTLLLCSTSLDATAQTPPPPRDDIDPGALRAALRRYDGHDPSVEQVVHAALLAHGADPSRAQEASERARWSGLLPNVRLGARRGLGWDLSQLTTTDSGRVQLGTADQLSLYGELGFDLDRLVYSTAEAAMLREARAALLARRELIRLVVTLYFERRRLMLERDLLAKRDLAHAVRIEEATALLDALTDGAFLRWRRRRSAPESNR